MRSVADLYKLKLEDTDEPGALRARSRRSTLLAEIERSKHAGLARVLMGMGIRFVGERTAEAIAQEFGSMDAIMNASAEELERVEEVGPRISEAITDFFARTANRELVERLKAAGVNMTAEKKAAHNAIGGVDVRADGTLPTLTREEAKAAH